MFTSLNQEHLWTNALYSSSRVPTHGPCQQEGCSGSTGVPQMRNLYEVNEEIIKPKCEAMRISYVELLRLQESTPSCGDSGSGGGPSTTVTGVPVDTFVSHWWGEEFPMMVRALKKYAKFRCDGQCHRRRKFTEWSFWICAFANNQFAVDHAVGSGGDVSTSAFAVALQGCREMVAVIDPGAQIYKRIWCAFELFYADSLPHRPRISLANDRGIFSVGAATRATVAQMRKLLSTVRVSEAKATVEADRVMIMNALAAAGVSTERLDTLLRKQVFEGLRMVCLRAKFFSQVAYSFLCGVVVVTMGQAALTGSVDGFIADYSWYFEWSILLHVPPLFCASILYAFFLSLAMWSDRGRNIAVDFMWILTTFEMPHNINAREKVFGSVAVLASAWGLIYATLKELVEMEPPEPGSVHRRPALFVSILAPVLFLESLALDMRLVPRRFRSRVAVTELLAVFLGMATGGVIQHTASRGVGAMVVFSWMTVVFAASLRDRCTPRIRRRIEEPMWS